MSKLNVSPWGPRQHGMPLYMTSTLALAGLLAVVQTSSSGASSFAVESALDVARWRGALLSNTEVSFAGTLLRALQDLVCFECAASYAKPVAALIVVLAAAWLVFEMRTSIAAHADS